MPTFHNSSGKSNKQENNKQSFTHLLEVFYGKILPRTTPPIASQILNATVANKTTYNPPSDKS